MMAEKPSPRNMAARYGRSVGERNLGFSVVIAHVIANTVI
jgi:hypothetical protein